jgi:hypothetical protein
MSWVQSLIVLSHPNFHSMSFLGNGFRPCLRRVLEQPWFLRYSIWVEYRKVKGTQAHNSFVKHPYRQSVAAKAAIGTTYLDTSDLSGFGFPIAFGILDHPQRVDPKILKFQCSSEQNCVRTDLGQRVRWNCSKAIFQHCAPCCQ